MDSEVVKKLKIDIEIGLDKQNFPSQITWQSSDAPANFPVQNAKAMLLSFLDRESGDTIKIDLRTNDLQMGEMNFLMFRTLSGLADTYFQATKNREMAEHLQHFAHFFGEKTEVLIPPK